MSATPTSYPANPLLAQRDRYRHWSQDHVRWSDTDRLGHTNNLTVGAFCETGRCLFMRHFFGDDGETRRLFLITQLIVNFLGESHWPDRVDVGTGVLSLGNSSVRLGQGVWAGERCIATSEAVLVMLDEATRRPLAMPADVRDYFSGYRLA